LTATRAYESRKAARKGNGDDFVSGKRGNKREREKLEGLGGPPSGYLISMKMVNIAKRGGGGKKFSAVQIFAQERLPAFKAVARGGGNTPRGRGVRGKKSSQIQGLPNWEPHVLSPASVEGERKCLTCLNSLCLRECLPRGKRCHWDLKRNGSSISTPAFEGQKIEFRKHCRGGTPKNRGLLPPFSFGGRGACPH